MSINDIYIYMNVNIERESCKKLNRWQKVEMGNWNSNYTTMLLNIIIHGISSSAYK